MIYLENKIIYDYIMLINPMVMAVMNCRLQHNENKLGGLTIYNPIVNKYYHSKYSNDTYID